MGVMQAARDKDASQKSLQDWVSFSSPKFCDVISMEKIKRTRAQAFPTLICWLHGPKGTVRPNMTNYKITSKISFVETL